MLLSLCALPFTGWCSTWRTAPSPSSCCRRRTPGASTIWPSHTGASACACAMCCAASQQLASCACWEENPTGDPASIRPAGCWSHGRGCMQDVYSNARRPPLLAWLAGLTRCAPQPARAASACGTCPRCGRCCTSLCRGWTAAPSASPRCAAAWGVQVLHACLNLFPQLCNKVVRQLM